MSIRMLVTAVACLGIMTTMKAEETAPLTLSAKIHPMGGNVRGFGVLASYDSPPAKIQVTRTTAIPKHEPMKPWCVVTVHDPQGNTVAAIDMAEQTQDSASYELMIPSGKSSGIWRVSVRGGRKGDQFDITMPSTPTWGIRGEMALGVTTALPEEMYLYLPPSTQTLIVVAYGEVAEGLTVNLENGETLPLIAVRNRHLGILENPPTDSVAHVTLANRTSGGIACDGVPGLLCPTAEAARILQGGTVEESGLHCAGPLQARARAWMVKQSPEDLAVQLDWPTSVPDDLENPRLEALLWGKYGPLSSLEITLPLQNLDPTSPFYGSMVSAEKAADRPDWSHFLYGGSNTVFDASGMAAAATVPGKLNPAFGNQAIVKRATLSAFYQLAGMQGDDLLREGNLGQKDYPITHAFFTYGGAIARPYEMLKDKLDPEAKAIWREGAIAVGDKIGDFMAYESNQWAHVIEGHLDTYLATGEPRFLAGFERMTDAFVNGAFGPNSKHGQHPTGFYLEEYGPDGNYDHLSSYTLVSCYFAYRELPEAKLSLLQDMRDAIARNLHFKSFVRLPQTMKGTPQLNAFNCRTSSTLANPSYPGDFMAHPEFGESLTWFNKNDERPGLKPGEFPDSAKIFSHLANSDAWAMALLKELVPQQGHAFTMGQVMGQWTKDLRKAYSLPITAQSVPLPCEQERGLWELPGLVAWKRGPIYGLVFYDVTGGRTVHRSKGVFGGGLTALWTPALGTVLGAAQNAQHNKVKTTDDLTFPTVYWQDANGKLWYTGHEAAQLTWKESHQRFVISQQTPDGNATLTWDYTLSDTGAITIQVDMQPRPATPITVSLPLSGSDELATVGPADGVLRLEHQTGTIAFHYAPEAEASLSAPLATSHAPVRCLRLTLPEAKPLQLTIDQK